MELKEVILSTLAEIAEEPTEDACAEKIVEEVSATKEASGLSASAQPERYDETEPRTRSEEREFLERLRERLLVLFEGFQSPNNKRVEAKIDLTLNFLEYLLATLDERIDSLKKP